MTSVDLNCDMGESYGIWTLGDDQALLNHVSSANLACGFHAGDPTTLRIISRAAVARGVQVGAQVAYPDLMGFGRRRMDIDPTELRDLILYQIGALDGFLRLSGERIRYVKPHGALYHAANEDPCVAQAVVDASREFDPHLAVMGAPDSALLAAAESAGLRPVREAFADRAYLPDGSLQPRSAPGSVLTDPEQVVRRVLQMVHEATVQAVDGRVIACPADSICLHSDTPHALTIAVAVTEGLRDAGVEIRPFPSP